MNHLTRLFSPHAQPILNVSHNHVRRQVLEGGPAFVGNSANHCNPSSLSSPVFSDIDADFSFYLQGSFVILNPDPEPNSVPQIALNNLRMQELEIESKTLKSENARLNDELTVAQVKD